MKFLKIMTKNEEIHVAVDEAGNLNDEKPFVVSAVLIRDINSYLNLYEYAIKDVQKLTGKNIKYFKWSEDLPKQSRLGKDVKGVFINKVLKSLTGVSLIIRKENGVKLTEYSAKIYGKILGLELRKYIAGKKIFVHYDRTPILRGSDKQYIIVNFHKWTLAKVIVDFTGHDKCRLIHSADYVSGIVREYLMKDELKEEYKQRVEEYFNLIKKNFEIKEINIDTIRET
jgi:hypothetical protein